MNGAPTSLSDNRAELPCTVAFPEIQSAVAWDATSSYFQAGIQPPTMLAGSSMSMILQQDSNNHVCWHVESFTGETVVLTARLRVAGVNDDANLMYDSVQHAYWRIREVNGYVYWDTSPNGQYWTNQRYEPTTGLDLSAVTVRLVCGTTGEYAWVLYGDGGYGDGVYGGGT